MVVSVTRHIVQEYFFSLLNKLKGSFCKLLDSLRVYYEFYFVFAKNIY
jgi:hypothetical protein